MTIHEFGQNHDEVVLLVHPSAVMWDYFEYVIPLMQDRYHLIVPALPGYDENEKSDFTSVEQIASELNKWLKSAGIAEVYAVYGCSMGGSVALMVTAATVGTGALLTADIAAHIISSGNRATGSKAVCTGLTLGTAACAATMGYFYVLYKAFDYGGKRKLSKQIIEGIADYVTIPDGGTGLDVGCGSGALAIVCAKRNPNADIIGIDHWGPEYRDFTKNRCERNVAAEGVSNVRFRKGDVVKLDFPDESFDLVTSNYVYHNIMGKDKQTLLLETLRVLKKGGTFAIHDIMSKARYGDMNAFVSKLKAMGYEDVQLIDTTNGKFMSRKEAVLLGLCGSTLLIGKK